MLGMAALAQLALAEFPGEGSSIIGESSPAWRRWLAQLYPEQSLNRVPDNTFVGDIIRHMLREGEALGEPLKRDWRPDLNRIIRDYEDEDEEDLIALLLTTIH